ncbi:TIR-like protein FxsC [Phytohabitans sp. ZYX-F-186]|uniref:TIR-like protein FxsC n=1 Tax=Phytohabitans maris TaxID=3071409 RepID=A0ABU0ZDB9_9ACTN|nr:TIR-like protein FxsC [Phytohabitans sp. ZYX-F-186]MDQ7904337.1 TIR-like protein FxsC [Phytohabitans sp. ZYX-F-186]
MPERLPYFFLSYARGGDDAYVRKFFEELCKEVRMRSGEPAGFEIGFLDTRDIGLGAPWTEELTSALQRSRTFVALCSPLYFNSEYCGKEWAVFAERVRYTSTQSGSRPPLMFPLVWMAGTAMHNSAQELQQTTEHLGLRYREDGLRNYMRLGKHRDRRLSFISALAEMIVANARTFPLQPLPGRTDIRFVQSTFAPEKGPAGSAALRHTAKHVHFVVAAASREHMRAHRTRLDYYGDTYGDWAPYRPHLSQPLGSYASAIAARRQFRAEVADIGELSDRAERARAHNQLLVLLVDAWATQLTEHGSMLAQHDADGSATAAVMIPLNRHDNESIDHWRTLDEACRMVLARSARHQDPRMFRFGVPTHDDFTSVLDEVLEHAYNRLLAEGESLRVPPDLHVDRPILDGPQSRPENETWPRDTS